MPLPDSHLGEIQAQFSYSRFRNLVGEEQIEALSHELGAILQKEMMNRVRSRVVPELLKTFRDASFDMQESADDQCISFDETIPGSLSYLVIDLDAITYFGKVPDDPEAAGDR